jgi:TldD protein
MNMERIRDVVKRKDVDYMEIRAEEGAKTDIIIRGREVDTVKQGRFVGGNARVLIGGVWGFVYFNNLEELQDKVNKAVEQAKTLKGIVNERTGLAPTPVHEKIIKASVQKDPYLVPLSEKVKLLSHYSDVALAAAKNIATTIVAYSDMKKNVYFANSEGTYVEKEILDIGGYVIPVASNGETLQRTMAPFGSSSDYSVVENLDEKIKERAKLAEKLLSAEKVVGGEYPVIIDPHLGGVFIHEAFGHLSEADFIYENDRMKDIMRIGNKIGSDILNVFDTGDIPDLRGSLQYDDEGVQAKKVYLIKNGVLSGHLHSRETAYKMGEEATGNGRAINYKFAPIPRMRTTCIEKGNGRLEDFVKDIKKGVYAKGSFGGQTNGDLFTFVSEEAYLIENGKISKLLRNVSLSGNVFETLKNIVGVADDFEIRDTGGGCGKAGQFPLPVSHGAPHVYIKKAIVGGK